MRFDDSLKTVLAADTSTLFGATAAFRQLSDLIARGRAAPDAPLLDRLAALRSVVPLEVRTATARGLALADPPAALVRLFAQDRHEVAGAVLRAARLSPEDWEALIPAVGPVGRSVLRRRDDLPPSAIRALDAFGSVDFSLSHDGPVAPESPAMVAEAPPAAPSEPAAERFEIADLVHRIEAFQRERGGPAESAPDPAPVARFRFETDGDAVIRWIDTGPRGALVGLRLRHDAADPSPIVDGIAAGAFRKRAAFANARLLVPGGSPLAGEWRIAAAPMFDEASGRFLGYRGHARRPQPEESAAPPRRRADRARIEGLRRLVHELRTPTNAIAGFSELIESELLGPVAPPYRDRAGDIRHQAGGLIAAIDDLELAARLEGDALELRAGEVRLTELLGEALADLLPLVRRRGSAVNVTGDAELAAAVDERAAARLVGRLLTTLTSVTRSGEALRVDVSAAPDGGTALIAIGRPAALAGLDEAALFGLEIGSLEADDDAPLLGLGFALRLSRNLAAQLGGRLTIAADRLTVALPAALKGNMGQAFSTIS